MTVCLFLLSLASASFAAGRFFDPGHTVSAWGGFEAFAHIWMGMLLALLIVWRSQRKTRWLLTGCILVPSLVELALFLTGPYR